MMKLMHFILLLAIVPAICGHSGHCNTQSYIEEWIQAGQIVSRYAWPLKALFCQLIDSILQGNNINLTQQCRHSLHKYKETLAADDHEALVLLDSSSHFQPGFLTDRVHSFGQYDQCIKSSFDSKPSRYALLQVKWPLPQSSSSSSSMKSMTNQISKGEWQDRNHSWLIGFSKNVDHFERLPQLVAICIPSQCGKEDLEEVASWLSLQVKTFSFALHSSQSVIEDPHAWYNGSFIQNMSRCILITLATWIIIATTVCQVLGEGHWSMRSFDVINNTKQLFDLSKDVESRTNFISGYKGLYLLTSIFHHLSLPLEPSIGHFFLPIHFLMQSDAVWKYSSRLFSGYSAIVSMSAMLQSISWFKSREQPFIIYIVRRALRTLPVTIVRLLFTFSLPIAYFAGPLVSDLQNSLLKKCIKSSWMEFAFIGNFIPFHKLCFSVSWFISADFQLYALSFFILYVLSRSEKLGFALVAITVAIGFTLEATVLNTFDIRPATAMINVPRLTGVQDIFYYAHILTHNYLASYALGILFGYWIHKRIRINHLVSAIAMVLFTIPVVGVFWTYDEALECTLSRPMEILYSSVFRVSATCLVGIGSLILLSFQPSRLIRVVLGNKLLLLMNRLSFVAYMIHPFVIFYMQAIRTDTDYSASYNLMQFVFITVVSLTLGIVLKVSVEVPFDKIVKERLFCQGKRDEGIKAE